MASFIHDCPSCGSRNAAFEIGTQYPYHGTTFTWWILVLCGVCKEAALAQLIDLENKAGKTSIVSPMEWGKGNPLIGRFNLVSFVPEPKRSIFPPGIPENVLIPLKEAELSFNDGRYTAAASCYRKAMERAIKNIDASIDGILNKRIRDLEKTQLFPKAMIDLADQVRLFGNLSMHEDEYDPTKEDCEVARDFSMLFLTYAFSLPEKIAAAQEKAKKQ